jgi:tetratricopeptide (TPR) repeat protein
VQKISIHPIRIVKMSTSSDASEIHATALKLKTSGNEYFMDKNYPKAIETYQEALKVIAMCKTPSDNDLIVLKSILLSNATISYGHIPDWNSVILYSSMYIQEFPEEKSGFKMYYWRGKAKRHLEDYKGAKEDLTKSEMLTSSEIDSSQLQSELLMLQYIEWRHNNSEWIRSAKQIQIEYISFHEQYEMELSIAPSLNPDLHGVKRSLDEEQLENKEFYENAKKNPRKNPETPHVHDHVLDIMDEGEIFDPDANTSSNNSEWIRSAKPIPNGYISYHEQDLAQDQMDLAIALSLKPDLHAIADAIEIRIDEEQVKIKEFYENSKKNPQTPHPDDVLDIIDEGEIFDEDAYELDGRDDDLDDDSDC